MPITAPLCLQPHNHTLPRLPLHGIAATRQLERLWLERLPAGTLMQRAGMAVARLAMAVAPHARHIWVACGYGNNGGDGLEAAALLQKLGKRVTVTLLASPGALPADAHAAYQHACRAGVIFSADCPPAMTPQDMCIDALLGIGATRAPDDAMRACIRRMQASTALILAIDVPTGLHADTGTVALNDNDGWVRASHTLTLLTLKPGLFTADGRDASGTVWWDGLGTHCAPPTQNASAWLQGACTECSPLQPEPAPLPPHASHKGSFGDVCIVGGATGMTGAALLAGSAALHAGAGRVHVGVLSAAVASYSPELMLRTVNQPGDLAALPLTNATVACGCGGGTPIAALLPDLLQQACRLVIDADGLNALSSDPLLHGLLGARSSRQQPTILTPHPAEAARLLGCNTADIQRDRVAAARALAEHHGCVVAVKGSGTVIAAPGRLPVVVHAGNARLATAGTGDVLAGCMAACWEQAAQAVPPGNQAPADAHDMAFDAACAAVHIHGHAADQWDAARPTPALTAGALATALQRPAL